MKDTVRRIYTRRGDRGETRLLSGETAPKDDLRVQTYGALDELQAHLGMARALIREDAVRTTIFDIQHDVSTACSELASTPGGLSRLERRIGPGDTVKLESCIDAFAASYGLPDGFVVPGRSPDSAALHVARTVCRRCERLIVTLNRQLGVYDEQVIYFNRLSDLLFLLAWVMEVMFVVENVVHQVINHTSEREYKE